MKLESNQNDTKHVGVLDEDAERPRAVDVWQKVLGRLQAVLPRPTFETWLKDTDGVRWEGNTLIVGVRTPFQAAWLERRMYTAVGQVVEQVTGVPADISFRLPDSPWNHPGMGKRSSKLEGAILDEFRSQLDISKVIGQYGSLQAFGPSYKANCPTCTGPTLHISDDRRSFRCFGPCGSSGDSIEWVMRTEHLGFTRAFRKLAKLGTALCTPGAEQSLSRVQDEWLANPIRLRSETHRGSNLLDVSDTTAGHTGGFRQIGSGREAPDDPVEYMAWLRRKRELLERRSRVASLPGFDREDRRPVLDNLAYPKGLDRLHLLPGRLGEGSGNPPGIVIVSYPNLQSHIRIERPDGRTAIVDRDDFFDGGSKIWTDRGTAILKDLQTGVHCAEEVEIKGISSKGFCLLRPPGLRDYTWFAPRQPEEAGGQNRPTRLTDGSSVHIYAVESINVDADVLTEYTDISGVVVKLQAAERSPGRHPDHLGLGH